MFDHRIYNFSAGPSMLPESVLKCAQSELLNYQGSGMSVMEMSHRSKAFIEIFESTEALFRDILGIPENYKVLLLQGGATQQFSAIPMNLMTKSGRADYILTGQFSEKAAEEAARYGAVNVTDSAKAGNFSKIPEQGELNLSPDADYVHICHNNTVFGTRWSYIPETGTVPLVSDMSSCILSEPVDVSKFGMIYAGAQKNAAPAGLTIVVIREDLIGRAMQSTPVMLNYQVQAKAESMYNTPSTYCIYMFKLVLEWLRDLGGLSAMRELNEKKAGLLYDCLDESKLFFTPSNKADRSIMNVTFRSNNGELDDKFVKQAAEQGLLTLKGHRAVGGMRASIYNAMPYEGVLKLVEFIRAFEREHD